MPRVAKMPKSRLNLEMSEEMRRRLEALMIRTDAESKSEVIRRALTVFDLLWTQRENGGRVLIEEADGKSRDVLLT